MKRVLVIALLATALSGSQAAAHTTIIESPSARYPFQRWVNRAHVPVPPMTLEVHYGLSGNPCRATAQGCTDLTGIWVPRDEADEVRFIFLHEVGHNFDAAFLADADRKHLARLFRSEVWPPGASELFANSYAICALHRHIRSWWIEGISRSRQRRICGMIRHATPTPRAQATAPPPAVPVDQGPVYGDGPPHWFN